MKKWRVCIRAELYRQRIAKYVCVCVCVWVESIDIDICDWKMPSHLVVTIFWSRKIRHKIYFQSISITLVSLLISKTTLPKNVLRYKIIAMIRWYDSLWREVKISVKLLTKLNASEKSNSYRLKSNDEYAYQC